MEKLKILITVSAIACSIVGANGQDSLSINLAGDQSNTALISNIQRITFNEENMLLKTINGTENSYALDNITSITFLDEGDSSNGKNIETVKVTIHAGADGEIKVDSPFEVRKLAVLDHNGKEVAATNQHRFNTSSLDPGAYLLKVETSEGTTTKKFVKNK